MPRLVFVQRQVSQLDEPVYARIHLKRPGLVHVVYWNDYGLSRSEIDPEIGRVPDFRPSVGQDFPRTWINSANAGFWAVFRRIRDLQPRLVVLSDLPRYSRAIIATLLRRCGVKVALRSDKNSLSAGAKTGTGLGLERWLIKNSFDVLCPVSRLTTEYYAWPQTMRVCDFPYSTDENKFMPTDADRVEIRNQVRETLGIPDHMHVIVSAAKFVDRENPWLLIKSFEELTKKSNNVMLIAIGDGPLLMEIQDYSRKDKRALAVFVGYIPFREIQNYFFAGDIFVHLAKNEPWGVSPQDALLSGMKIITTDRVGSGKYFLVGPLSRFLVSQGHEDSSNAMAELVGTSRFDPAFRAARDRARHFTVEETAQRFVDLDILVQ